MEQEDEIRKRILAGVDILGAERILPDPDCGLRMLPPDIAYAKLKRLNDATEGVREELVGSGQTIFS